jgi:hypothetical protein
MKIIHGIRNHGTVVSDTSEAEAALPEPRSLRPVWAIQQEPCHKRLN